MDFRIQEWIDRKKFCAGVIKQLNKETEGSLERALKAPFPEKVRPAVVSDIVEGAVIWYKSPIEGMRWDLVGSQLYNGEYWLSYDTNNGSRFGLDDAYVEVEDE